MLNALCTHGADTDNSALKAIFIYGLPTSSNSNNQQDDDSEISGYKSGSIWICVINQSNQEIKFPTAINTHTIRGGIEVWLRITDTDNVIGLHSIKPLSEMKIVDLRPGELCIFKYKYDVSLKIDRLDTIPVELEVPKEIGQRYSCWSGTLSGKFQEVSYKLHDEIMGIVEEIRKALKKE